MKYIDIHTHLNLPQFEEDREEVVARMQEAGVFAINVGTHKDTSAKAVELAEQYDRCYACIGVHPCDVVGQDPDGDGSGGAERSLDLDFYRPLAQHVKTVAIGEVGFDYFHYGDDDENYRAQREMFETQIALANEVDKPLMLHIRHKKGQRDAYKDTLEVLKSHAKVLGNVHFFASDYEHAKMFFDIGYTVSFTGVLTFARDYDETVKNAPLNMLHAETDAPYVAPIPFRGQRNEPVHVREVYKKIAELRSVDPEEVREQLVKNAQRLFKIQSY